MDKLENLKDLPDRRWLRLPGGLPMYEPERPVSLPHTRVNYPNKIGLVVIAVWWILVIGIAGLVMWSVNR